MCCVLQYAMPDLARKDIYNALSLYSDLRPSLEMFGEWSDFMVNYCMLYQYYV